MHEKTNEAASFPSSQPSIQSRFHHKIFLARRAVSRKLSHLRSRLWRTTNILRDSWGSFRGHISVQSATKRTIVYFGPLFEILPHTESPVLNTRTIARCEYTKALSEMHSWADAVDHQIFLMGFEAGEQWSLHYHMDMARSKHPFEMSSWLDLPEHNQILDRIHQQIKASNDQTSEVTPSAIAGLTRKD